MKFVLASNNKKKLKEMAEILEQEGCSVVPMGEMGFDSDPEETGSTFEENALIKAKAAMAKCALPCIADDSGLEVDALGGAPGIRSARYCEGSDLERTLFLLENMKGVENRRARFVSAVACAFPDGSELVVRGECPGEILGQLKGEGGFGYDPVFYIPSEGCTYAQMNKERKNKISHRAKAMESFCRELRNKRNEEKR
ncbi:MAG: RdgB/HAM1 family non-canonical purine NTP pyrophosphatase [Clostridiaceae bacterium]|nr:RdgB/HAM1 family non-canonical purine NTP pyrophosphatase [Clostridiaceae bacterium]